MKLTAIQIANTELAMRHLASGLRAIMLGWALLLAANSALAGNAPGDADLSAFDDL